MFKLNIFNYINLNKNIINKILIILFFNFLFFFSNSLKSKNFDESIINNFHEILIINNASNDDLQNRTNTIKQYVENSFNFKKMIRYIYGYRWKDLTELEKKKLSQTFLDFISFNYAKRFKNINKLYFKFDGTEDINDTRLLVKTLMTTSDKEPIKFYYVFDYEDEKWKIFDILLNGSISEISVKKNDFKKIIIDEGVDGLIKKLNSKILIPGNK